VIVIQFFVLTSTFEILRKMISGQRLVFHFLTKTLVDAVFKRVCKNQTEDNQKLVKKLVNVREGGRAKNNS